MSEDRRPRELSLEHRVKALEDKEEIRELIARYAYHTMRANGEETGALYTDDGVFDARSPDGRSSDIRVEGKDNLIKFYNGLTPGGTTPLIHDHIVRINGDEAHGTCMLDSPCYTGERRGYIGYYEDELRRVDGRWRFKARVFFFVQGSVART